MTLICSSSPRPVSSASRRRWPPSSAARSWPPQTRRRSSQAGTWSCPSRATWRRRTARKTWRQPRSTGSDQSTANTQRSGSALPVSARDDIRRLIITASGGPFRTWPADRLESVTPDRGAGAPDLAHGRQDHDRLSDAHEQGIWRSSRRAGCTISLTIRSMWSFSRRASSTRWSSSRTVHSRHNSVFLICASRSNTRSPIPSISSRRRRAFDCTDLPPIGFEAPDLERFPALCHWPRRRTARAARVSLH